MLQALSVLTLVIGVAGATCAQTPWQCRPKIKWHTTLLKWELISSACPAIACPDDSGYTCDTLVIPGTGYQGCSCPTAGPSCVLIYKLLGGGNIDVQCKDYCPNHTCSGPVRESGTDEAMCLACGQ